MANLQSSTAIHFNRRFKRAGALFSRRFKKQLITSEKELDNWNDRLCRKEKEFVYREQWKNVKATILDSSLLNRVLDRLRCGAYYYERLIGNHPYLSSFKLVKEIDLQGQFIILPPKNIHSEYFSQNTKKKPPNPS
jgi:hypothetical protein